MLDPPRRDLSSKEHPPSRIAVNPSRGLETATQFLAGVALLGALKISLIASLLAGLLVYELVHVLAPGSSIRVTRRTGKIIII